MMPLVGDLTLREVRDEAERFDFLEGVRGLVLKAMEFHASEENDSEYVYLFWVSWDDDRTFTERVRSNVRELEDRDSHDLDGGWLFDVSNGTGLVMVRAYF